LAYIKNNEIKNYADAISYKTPYYNELGDKLKEISDKSDFMKIVCKN
jgi:hypothetical protein